MDEPSFPGVGGLESFRDADAAVARIAAIYDSSAEGIRRAFRGGTAADGGGRYPFVGIGIRAASAEHRDTPYDQYRAGMHHLCLRARSREDVDRCHRFLEALCAKHGGRIVHVPVEDGWAPGYYSVLFEDPCGTRLEVNHVPGKGNLDEAIELPLRGDVQKQLSQP